jgi:hypothetical protein
VLALCAPLPLLWCGAAAATVHTGNNKSSSSGSSGSGEGKWVQPSQALLLGSTLESAPADEATLQTLLLLENLAVSTVTSLA